MSPRENAQANHGGREASPTGGNGPRDCPLDALNIAPRITLSIRSPSSLTSGPCRKPRPALLRHEAQRFFQASVYSDIRFSFEYKKIMRGRPASLQLESAHPRDYGRVREAAVSLSRL